MNDAAICPSLLNWHTSQMIWFPGVILGFKQKAKAWLDDFEWFFAFRKISRSQETLTILHTYHISLIQENVFFFNFNRTYLEHQTPSSAPMNVEPKLVQYHWLVASSMNGSLGFWRRSFSESADIPGPCTKKWPSRTTESRISTILLQINSSFPIWPSDSTNGLSKMQHDIVSGKRSNLNMSKNDGKHHPSEMWQKLDMYEPK